MKKAAFFIFLIASLTIVFYLYTYGVEGGRSSGEFKFSLPLGAAHQYSDVRVSRVIDGDTILIQTGERVRLIGIDTPELHDSEKLHRDARKSQMDVRAIQEMGKRAYEFTRNLVEGKQVSLQFDVEKYDKYGRLLAYVYLKDGTFVNAEIVKQGYASLMSIPPNIKHADLFYNLYQQARDSHLGLWQ